MFLAHFAVGFASKRVAPRASLGPLLAAPLLLDLLWPIFLLLGWERVRIDPGNTPITPLAFDAYPWSHSLVMAVGWAALFALLYWARTRYRAGALIIAVGVVSHWVLDAVSHRPDLPLYPGASPLVGLGLWNSVAATVVVEGAAFAAGVWLYAAGTRSRDRVGRVAWWALVGFLVTLYAASLAGPPPPEVTALAVAGLATWLFPLWAGWLDRHREVVA